MDQIVGLEPGPSRRGTFDILYSCISTLVICVWTTVHMDVGPEDETFWQHVWKKAKWTLFTIMFPEYMLYKAATLFTQARDAVSRIERYCARNRRRGDPVWTLSDGFFSRMRGFTYGGDAVDDERIVELMERREIPAVRSHSREIRDRSKTDGFAKWVACTKASWLVIQCIARKADRLPISLLELGTITYVVLSLAIYVLLWHAPRDVSTQIPISPKLAHSSDDSPGHPDSRPVPTIQEPRNIVGVRQEELIPNLPQVLIAGGRLGSPAHLDPELPSGPEHPATIPLTRLQALRQWIDVVRNQPWDNRMLLLWGCMAWGALHCLAWRFFFPSPVEKWLWRICSILSAVGPWSYLDELTKAARSKRKDWDEDAWFGALVGIVAVTIRSILLIEMFISLRRMPSDVYVNIRWSSFVPHL